MLWYFNGEVTDISVLELLVTFIQYVHDGEVKTNFLFVEDLLKASSSADVNTIYTAATTKLLSFKLELNNWHQLLLIEQV